ncbi:hypothetical protein ACLZH7_32390 [Streptomyces sp. BG2AG]|uniref:sulfotransferase-like domain-containing protein n=1 Tax=unclassified Streptomyces TaxID=2593676 RepID=UPI0039F0D145
MHRSVALWSHPRSLSTALERSFIERGDFAVFHEAFAYVYFMHEERAAIPHKNQDPDHPLTYPDVKRMMEDARKERPVFHKDFPYHCIDHLLKDPEYLLGQVNTFLIRDPEEAVLSHATVHPELTREVLGYEQLARAYDFVTELTGSTPVVVNAADLAARPRATLAAYCQAVGVPFLPDALRWPAGQQPQWATWSGWHTDVAASDGFTKPPGAYRFTYESRPELREFERYCRPFYDHLDQHRLRPTEEATV